MVDVSSGAGNQAARFCSYCGQDAVAHVDTETWESSRDMCAKHLQHVMDGSCGDAFVSFFTGEGGVIKR